MILKDGTEISKEWIGYEVFFVMFNSFAASRIQDFIARLLLFINFHCCPIKIMNFE
jgi:hypothetical protein